MIHVNSADYSYNAPSTAVLNDYQNALLPMFDFGIDLIQNVCRVN